jgi:Active DUF488-N3 subclade
MKAQRISSDWSAPVTACWSAKLPETYQRIGISRGPPRGQKGYRMYSQLAPGPWFRSLDAEAFRKRYLGQLSRLDPAKVLEDLAAMAKGRTPALLCFETPETAWCHRSLVSVWFADTLGLRIIEYGHADAAWGWSHPLLVAEWRQPAG